ncbi:hypothetical protein [Streptomyces sp. NPDC001137]|uniref:hypothetical protein n=1 Tax=Streptomyces sp. NPDC001137 TaxID=3154378 RepID=UPI00331E1AB5
MNTRRRSALAIATLICAAAAATGPTADALAAPAAPAVPPSLADTISVQTSWTRLWQSTISKDYMQAYGKWISQGYREPNGSRIARGVFSCTGGGEETLTVRNLDTGQKESKTHRCNGDRHHTPVVSYRNGETVKLILKGSKKTTVEAWAGR